MKSIKISLMLLLSAVVSSCCNTQKPVAMEQWISEDGTEIIAIGGEVTLSENVDINNKVTDFLTYVGAGSKKGFTNFEITGRAKTVENTTAALRFHTDETGKGYEVFFCNDEPNGIISTGSLVAARNLYKSMAKNDEWFTFAIAVRGENIIVKINDIDVVCYTEPSEPYRITEHATQLLGSGTFALITYTGEIQFADLILTPLSSNELNVNDTIPAINEQTDSIIRLQQKMFPVIDYHVHLKGWTKEQAHSKSMNYGINYGIAPNCGIGFPVTDDAGVLAYRDSTKMMPFFFGMQGEGREWPMTFSADSRSRFDYVFTDAMTFTDHKNRRTRMWIAEETFIDIPQEKYMDLIVEKIIKVLDEEPIDIYVNPFWVPDAMHPDYDKLWTPERIKRVVDAISKKGCALEINARYRVPNFAAITAAKEAGIKFAFGTNNATPDLGKLEYCIEAIKACNLTADDIWFPSDKCN